SNTERAYQQYSTTCILIGLVLVLYWWITKRTGITIYSVSGKSEVNLQASGANQKHIKNIIEYVLKAIEKNNVNK
ncbi:MAG: hypothetical protein ACHQ6U_12870, partial [Thermodesulfobacteriota bacterium]